MPDPLSPRQGLAGTDGADSIGPAPVTVVIDDLHVRYRVYDQRRRSLREVVTSRFRPNVFREVHAVRGVDLVLRAGECVGVIGRNGSGKSTLLRAIAGLLPATRGAVYARSEPALLGVSAALNPALSGRRNVVLGGLALGLTGEEVRARLDEVVEFAGVREFIDMPMRTYSSGMRARLHFAIATAVLPEVLLVDETLAVGDADFRARSQERVRQLRENAGTVVVVSHSMSTIREMCTRVVWLDAGRVVAVGHPAKVVGAYVEAVKAGRPAPKASTAPDTRQPTTPISS